MQCALEARDALVVVERRCCLVRRIRRGGCAQGRELAFVHHFLGLGEMFALVVSGVERGEFAEHDFALGTDMVFSKELTLHEVPPQLQAWSMGGYDP